MGVTRSIANEDTSPISMQVVRDLQSQQGLTVSTGTIQADEAELGGPSHRR
jgi:hypothetical protein